MTDEETAAEAQNGDSAAVEILLDKYKFLVRSEAHGYFLMGADHEDIVQEGMIGLYKSIRDYRADRHFSFRAFAEMCIKRQIMTAIRMASRQKHIPMNTYVSLNSSLFTDSARERLEAIDSGISDPEQQIIDEEDMHNIQEKLIGNLTVLEKQVLMMYMDGRSYLQISRELGRSEKSIDNAMQRIKKKALRYLAEKKQA